MKQTITEKIFSEHVGEAVFAYSRLKRRRKTKPRPDCRLNRGFA